MSERKYQRNRTINGQRYFHTERDTDNRPNERYGRNGPLSPLRSPVNREKVAKRKNRMNKLRSPNSKSNLDFQIKVRDFPPLGNNQHTPEMGPIKHNSANLDWATQVDTFEKLAVMENEKLRTYRRKLEMGGVQNKAKPVVEMEEDSTVLIRRQKAIDYGKNTPGYQHYLHQVRRTQRTTGQPKTPNKYIKTSRRSWDMQIRLWKRSLHKYDPPSNDDINRADVSMTEVSSVCSDPFEQNIDSDTSDNGSDLLDYRDGQSNEHFSHHLSEDDNNAHSSLKDMNSLENNNWVDPLYEML